MHKGLYTGIHIDILTKEIELKQFYKYGDK